MEIGVLVKIFLEEVQKGIGGEGTGPAIEDYGPRGCSGEVKEWRDVSQHYGHVKRRRIVGGEEF